MSDKIELLKCKIKENIQKIELFDLTTDRNKEIVINHLKKENEKLKNMLLKLKIEES
ncbi:hypothetical protein ES703_110255 [subsurface metagenome]